MSEPAPVRLRGVGKMYRVFPDRSSKILGALGLDTWVPGLKVESREFWALRGIDLELAPASRVGLIGRNGAGKSTLLKLITGNLSVSEGEIEVRQSVNALLDSGAGFHPEFTGAENVRAVLDYHGLSDEEVEAAFRDVAEFTELGRFLDQPFRTYSAGMQARLAFATATAVRRPGILIIDEILGAGDAYFISKSAERMQDVVTRGTTVLLVSHSLDQVTRLCEEAIWIDRGSVVERGSALHVVKSYQRFINRLDDRRLRARNRRQILAGGGASAGETAADLLGVELEAGGAASSRPRVAEVRLLRDGDVEETLRVGHAQDGESSHTCYAELELGGWGPVESHEGQLARPLGRDGGRRGQVTFRLPAILPESEYSLQLLVWSDGDGELRIDTRLNGALLATTAVALQGSGWAEHTVPLARPAQVTRPATGTVPAVAAGPAGRPSRWLGEGGLIIQAVRLLGEAGDERTVFESGGPVQLEMLVRCERAGSYPLVPAAVLYRLDGLLVSRYVGGAQDLTLEAGDLVRVRLRIAPLRLGNGAFVFTVALYRALDLTGVEASPYYDMLDRSYEFAVRGCPPLLDGVFREEGAWTVEPWPAAEAAR